MMKLSGILNTQCDNDDQSGDEKSNDLKNIEEECKTTEKLS